MMLPEHNNHPRNISNRGEHVLCTSVTSVDDGHGSGGPVSKSTNRVIAEMFQGFNQKNRNHKYNTATKGGMIEMVPPPTYPSSTSMNEHNTTGTMASRNDTAIATSGRSLLSSPLFSRTLLSLPNTELGSTAGLATNTTTNGTAAGGGTTDDAASVEKKRPYRDIINRTRDQHHQHPEQEESLLLSSRLFQRNLFPPRDKNYTHQLCDPSHSRSFRHDSIEQDEDITATSSTQSHLHKKIPASAATAETNGDVFVSIAAVTTGTETVNVDNDKNYNNNKNDNKKRKSNHLNFSSPLFSSSLLDHENGDDDRNEYENGMDTKIIGMDDDYDFVHGDDKARQETESGKIPRKVGKAKDEGKRTGKAGREEESSLITETAKNTAEKNESIETETDMLVKKATTWITELNVVRDELQRASVKTAIVLDSLYMTGAITMDDDDDDDEHCQ